MKLGQIINPAFAAALGKLRQEPVPTKGAMKLKSIIETVQQSAVKYDNLRLETLAKHGLKNEDGSLKINEQGNAEFADGDFEKFSSDFSLLLNIEVDLPVVSVDELEGVKLSVDDLTLLGFIV
jgi:hypothetical protein